MPWHITRLKIKRVKTYILIEYLQILDPFNVSPPVVKLIVNSLPLPVLIDVCI